MVKLKISMFLLVMIFATTSFALASEIILKSGQKLEGKIVEQTDKYVKFDSGVGIVMTYYIDEIDTVDGNKLQVSIHSNLQPTGNSPQQADVLQTQIPSKDVSDGKATYEQRLTVYLKDAMSKSPATDKDFEDLFNFSKEFPNSEYVDDVKFLYLFGLSGAHKYPIDKWDVIAEKNPNGQVSELTRSLFKKYFFVLPPMYVPYSIFILNIKGDDAFWNKKNYADSANYYIKFLKSLDYSDALQKELVVEPYMFLLLSYKNLKQKDDFDKTKAEFLSMFPDRSKEINEIEF